MKEINSAIINKLTPKIWSHMHKSLESHLGKRTAVKLQLEFKLHDKLEDRIKFKVMIPLQWKLNTLLRR